MKSCPNCNRSYSDLSFSFCLEDGTLLSVSYEADEIQSNNDEIETKISLKEKRFEETTLVNSPNNRCPTEAKKVKKDSLIKSASNLSRSQREETGLSKENPKRGNRESDTYWHTRVLTHSILGEHYRTPQFNLKLLMDYLNSKLPIGRAITRISFVAPKDENLNFYMKNYKISCSAHEPISKEDFLKKFDLIYQDKIT